MNTITTTKRLLPILFLTAVASPALAGTCATDLDGDGATGFGDLTAMLSAWGPCAACPEDVNSDGAVGFSDLTDLLNAWGPCPIVNVFDYPEYEDSFALLVGQQFLNTEGPIALPQATYDRMDRDMGLILAAHPELEGTNVSNMWRWVPFRLFVGIDTSVPSDEFDAMLAYYQGEVIASYGGGSTLLLDFPLGANPQAMIPILTALDSVEYGEPDSYILTGDLTPRWEPTDVGADTLLWTVVVAWGNGALCDIDTSTCECFTTYEFVIQPDGSMSELPIESVPSPWNPDGTCDGYPPAP